MKAASPCWRIAPSWRRVALWVEYAALGSVMRIRPVSGHPQRYLPTAGRAVCDTSTKVPGMMPRPDYSNLSSIVPSLPAGQHRCGVRLSAQPHPAATVVRISGDIDACNADDVSDYLGRFDELDHPVVLDLSGVDFLAVAGFRAILQFGAECRRNNLPWALVTSHAVDILLRLTANDRPLPTVRSGEEALQRLKCAAEHAVPTSVGHFG